MFTSATPNEILQGHAETLREQLPRVYNGDVEGVHTARVASRRIREVLPLTFEWHSRDAVEDLTGRFRRIGRRLGRVRDADVRIALLSYLETRIPSAAPFLFVVRQQREGERLVLMRKLVKRFERLEVDSLLRRLTAGSARAARPWTRMAGGWRPMLRRAVAERAHTASEAIDHATGLYFPNRLHQARIAIKKFRYAAEIAQETGIGPRSAEASLRRLKRAQDALGDLHDRQTLIDELSSTSDGGAEVDADHVRRVIQIAEAECRDLHAKYHARRPRLLAICHRAEARRTARMPIAPVATLIAASSAFYLWRREAAARALPARDEEVSVRVPIRVTEPGW